MRYFIISGEASGDLHGSGLVRALYVADPSAKVHAWGGDMMQAAGAMILKHYRDLAFMGFIEVVKNLPTILRNFKRAKEDILKFRPDVLILIDYPGFNLRMARWASEHGLRVHYYISPQLWAWKEGRVESIRKFVEHMYVILPFEQSFYKRHNIDVTYVGHPLLEAIEHFRESSPRNIDSNKYIALLAGSRIQEIKHSLPVMLALTERFPGYQFCIAAAPHVPESLYKRLMDKYDVHNVSLRQGETYDVLNKAHAALTTSGTATLETALFGVPQVVCYKGNALSFQIARRLVKVPYISLVNLIAGKPVVEELIQENFNATRLSKALERILNPAIRQEMIEDYHTLVSQLEQGGASQIVARQILQSLNTAHETI